MELSPNPHTFLLLCRNQPAAQGCECLLRPLALSDVRDHADHPHYLAVGVERGASGVFEPCCSTVRAQRLKVDLISRVLRSEPGLGDVIHRAVIGMNPCVKLPTAIM